MEKLNYTKFEKQEHFDSSSEEKKEEIKDEAYADAVIISNIAQKIAREKKIEAKHYTIANNIFDAKKESSEKNLPTQIDEKVEAPIRNMFEETNKAVALLIGEKKIEIRLIIVKEGPPGCDPLDDLIYINQDKLNFINPEDPFEECRNIIAEEIAHYYFHHKHISFHNETTDMAVDFLEKMHKHYSEQLLSEYLDKVDFRLDNYHTAQECFGYLMSIILGDYSKASAYLKLHEIEERYKRISKEKKTELLLKPVSNNVMTALWHYNGYLMAKNLLKSFNNNKKELQSFAKKFFEKPISDRKLN